MMVAMRKDVGHRTLVWCEACLSIVDVPLQPDQRVRELEDHILDEHPTRYNMTAFVLLESQLWGTGHLVPRMRRP
jgi:hypothetical protein